MKKLTPAEIEIHFDAQELDLISDASWTPLQKSLFEKIEKRSFESAMEICEHIFATEDSVVNKVFAIQWAVALSEVTYNMNLRSQWMEKWQELHFLNTWTEDAWCRYIYRDQQALGYYFSSNFTEAKKIFEKNILEATDNKYARGEMRTLYHLGLIHKCLEQNDKAFDFLVRSLEVGRKLRAVRFIPRIEEQLSLLKKDWVSFDFHVNQTETYLLNKNYRAARKLVLYICKIRRHENRSWFSKSEHILLALVCYAYRQYRRFNLIFKKIRDPVLKLNLLKAVNKISPLNNSLKFEQELLYQSLNIDKNMDTTVIYKGINFGSAKNSEAAALIHALSENPNGLTKEDIVRYVFKTNDYDPTYHDQKIYRLINKIRKSFGQQTVISNYYNLYKIS